MSNIAPCYSSRQLKRFFLVFPTDEDICPEWGLWLAAVITTLGFFVDVSQHQPLNFGHYQSLEQVINFLDLLGGIQTKPTVTNKTHQGGLGVLPPSL